MKVVFYCFFGIVALLGSWFVLSSLLGQFSLRGAAQGPAKLALLFATVLALWALRRAYELGEQQGRYGLGLAWIGLAFLVFELTLVLAALVLGKGQ